MRFNWDQRKAIANKIKHGVTFEQAITVFDDPYALIAPDPKHSLVEKREWIIGEADDGVLVVVFTKRARGKIIRVISARRANKKERVHYEEYKRISL